MRLFEALQYKARAFLYEKNRQRAYKKQGHSYKNFEADKNLEENGRVKEFWDSLDEIDIYLEEKIDEWNFKIRK